MLQPRKRRLFTPATPNDVGTAAKLLQIEKIIKSDSEKSIIVKFANLDDQQELLELTIEAYLEKQPEGIIMHISSKRYVEHWKKKFVNLVMVEASKVDDLKEVLKQYSNKHLLIISSAERMIHLSRKWGADRSVSERLSLLMVENGHLLNNDCGSTIETLITRLRLMKNNIRIIYATSMLPNSDDIFKWLDHESSGILQFTINEKIPSKVEKLVMSFPLENNNLFMFENNLTYKIPSLMKNYSRNKPTIIFCSCRSQLKRTVEYVEKRATQVFGDNGFTNDLKSVSKSFQDDKLKATLKMGIGFHHHGLAIEDRDLIERLFNERKLPLLVTTPASITSKLPAYLVIIKGTQFYRGSKYEDYNESNLADMCKHTGSEVYNYEGKVLMLTQKDQEEKWKCLINNKTLLESSLRKNFHETIICEIALNNITSMTDALDWIKSTFLYVRARQNPNFYELRDNTDESFSEMISYSIEQLEHYGFVKRTNGNLSVTEKGSLLVKSNLIYETFINFLNIKGTESLYALMKLLTNSLEFDTFQLRTSEKISLKQLNLGLYPRNLRFPFVDLKAIKETSQKINILLQAKLGRVPIGSNTSLDQEAISIVQIARNICQLLMEYIRLLDNNFECLINVMLLQKSLNVELWDNSKLLISQIKGFSLDDARIMLSNNMDSWEEIANFEHVLKNSLPLFTDELKSFITRLPKFEISTSSVPRTNSSRCIVTAHQLNDDWDHEVINGNISLIIGDENNNLLAFRHDITEDFLKTSEFQLEVAAHAEKIFIHLIHSNFVGIDLARTVEIKNASNVAAMSRNNTSVSNKTTSVENMSSEGRKKKKFPTPFRPSSTALPNKKVLLNSSITDYFKSTELNETGVNQVSEMDYRITEIREPKKCLAHIIEEPVIWNNIKQSKDVDSYMADVKCKLASFIAPIKRKIQKLELENQLNCSVYEVNSINEPEAVCQQAEISKTEEPNEIPEKKLTEEYPERESEEIAHSQMKNKLTVTEDFSNIDDEKQLKVWQDIRYIITQPQQMINLEANHFRLRFNLVENVKHLEINKKATINSEIFTKTPATNMKMLIDKEPSKSLPRKDPPVLKSAILEDLFEVHNAHTPLSKVMSRDHASRDAKNFILCNLSRTIADENDNNITEQSHVMSTSSKKSFELDKKMFADFMKSLDEESSGQPPINTGIFFHTPSLSESARKLKRKFAHSATIMEFDQMLSGILRNVNIDPAPSSEKPTKLEVIFEENSNPSREVKQQVSDSKKITFKNRLIPPEALSTKKPEKHQVKRLVNGKRFNELERLHEKFKLTWKPNKEKAGNTTIESVYNKVGSCNNNNKLNLRTEPTKETFMLNTTQTVHPNQLKSYLQDFCREKFSD